MAPPRLRVRVKAALLVLSLGALLAFAAIGAVQAFSAVGAAMSMHAWIALALCTLFSIGLGAGLMMLSFHSARRGYDARAHGADRAADEAD